LALPSGDSGATRSDVKIHALVLAGGGGTRLWPLSRRSRPKQFLHEFTGRPLIADTVARLAPVVPASRVWVVGGAGHEAGVRDALPELPGAHFVREPAAKNTAPAIALGVSAIALENPDAVVAVLPSDHLIGKPDRFRAVLAAAGHVAAERGRLVTLGIVPDRPATGYGYIEQGPTLGRVLAAEAFEVKRFVEKPDASKAISFLKAGNYLWNAGIFVWRASDLLAAIDRHLPELGKGLADWRAAQPPDRDAIARRLFEAAPSISIDYAVLEKSDNVAVVPASDAEWDDIGSFRSLARVNADTTGGSATAKEVVSIDASGNLVHAPGKTVALVGVHDLIVVETADAILILPRDRAEDVKKVVDELARRKRDDAL
jgi:mannose-1-phosphate guanylyltransferase